VQIAGLLVIGDLAQTLKDIMVLKEELSSTVETITKDGRVNTLPINQSLSTKMSRVSYFGPALFFPHCRCLLLSTRQPLLLIPSYDIGNDIIYGESCFFMVSFTINLKRSRLKLRCKYPKIDCFRKW
jgi:hypothetical protein